MDLDNIIMQNKIIKKLFYIFQNLRQNKIFKFSIKNFILYINI
jgi:hypothetical protein